MLQKNFTGREAEMAMLSHWLLNEKEPVLVLEAIGGMGKSALSWVWLHNEVLERHIEIDGVFWWSFYEAPFETFLPNLADIHLFCGQVLLQLKEETKKELSLLGQSAREHLQLAKEYALDVSEFSHIYRSDNPNFYHGIPEYDMLKRGLTEQERITNGYNVAYRIADHLLSRADIGH